MSHDFRIFKYHLPVPNTPDCKVTLNVHGGRPEFIHVAEQDDIVCVWLRVDATKEKAPVDFYVYPTGVTIPYEREHLGTFFLQNEGLVFHLFRFIEGSTKVGRAMSGF